MNIKLLNCNNIDLANITISENKLNIKFASNGTGKSTIAKAILSVASGDTNSLIELMPFKLKESNPDKKQPEVIGIENIRKVMCFNEDYVNQIVFKQDELLSNSFEIFIKTDAYKKNEENIKKIIEELKKLFVNNQELETLISAFKNLKDAFKLTKTGISKSSTGMKGLSGNKIKHIPPEFELYKPFIQSKNNVGWIDWQIKGSEFSGLSDNCPFCTSDVTEKKENIENIGKVYDKSKIKNLVAIIDIIEKLGEYLSADAKRTLNEITRLKDGIEVDHEAFIKNIKIQIDGFLEKLENLRSLSGFHFKAEDKVLEKLTSYILKLQFFPELNSDKTKMAVEPINASLNTIITKASELHGKINIQRGHIKNIIEKHQNDINGFLKYAGYQYKVQMAGEGEELQLKLLHIDHRKHLSGGNQHLSFGERNAFAIVLFMYDCLNKNPGLIILDDPISSFDKNKKYAILEMLFRRDAKSCLKNKTVLMLTHDVEPIIDTVKSLYKQFNNQTFASFLKLAAGIITEKAIIKSDIKTFFQICNNAISSEKNEIIKLIYLRRYYEISDDKGDAYQVLSNLFHKRQVPIDYREQMDQDSQCPEMVSAKFESGCSNISDKLNNFSYADTYNRILDVSWLKSLYDECDNGYEKLQIFRLISLDSQNSVVKKFINETYHIENEFICQLNPEKFDTIPEYVINICNKHLVTD